MCGIAGFVALPNCGKSSKAPAVLEALEHRGPDDLGWLRSTGANVERGRAWHQPSTEPEVLLLHRRLSIIDTSPGGWQPMSTADGRFHIVFNGEIYNYLELRRELERLGHAFQSTSDTEVLLNAYAEWGTESFARLIGMFAFAVLDVQERSLLLVRDFFGIKPLYTWFDRGCLCFASEIKAFTSFGLSAPHANAQRLLLYLRYGVTDFGAETMLSEVQQVPAAHFVAISLDNCMAGKPTRFWSRDAGEVLDISFEEARGRVRDLFMRSVQLHLRSDVPLGSALSGGVDSSAIVMAIRELEPRAEIHAFSFIPEHGAPSEEKWVDIVGKQSGAQVHKVYAAPGDLAADFEAMIEFHDEPFGSTSAYAQFLVFRAARAAGVKVMLDGQGADEILGGYNIYKGARLASLMRQGRWAEAARLLNTMKATDGLGKALGLAYCADYLLPPSLQFAARMLIHKDAFPAWLNRRWFAERGATEGFTNYTNAHDVLRASLTRSVNETLPGLLRYEDRNSMACSVESRVPFLTPDLVSFMGRLPEEYLIDADGTSKAVFRAAMRGIVPDSVLDRRDKIGFATPERWWLDLLNGWVRGALDGEKARTAKFLDLNVARRELADVCSGARPFGFHVWRWVNLIRWSEALGVVFD
jgi:asparagine synthase (glutamine-hydrolysing)